MLRPQSGLLVSSRAQRRANVRAERLKALGHAGRALRAAFVSLFGGVLELLLLWFLPLAYFASSYLLVDLPARWFLHRPAWGGWGGLLFAAALMVALVGLARAIQGAEPVAPVRPQFAKAMLGLSWVAALILTIGDLAS